MMTIFDKTSKVGIQADLNTESKSQRYDKIPKLRELAYRKIPSRNKSQYSKINSKQ